MTSLFLKNLNEEVTKKVLEDTFRKYGAADVKREKIREPFAFVNFTRKDDAQIAMEELQGKELFGITLDISWAKQNEEKEDGKKETSIKNQEQLILDYINFGYSYSATGLTDSFKKWK